VDVVAAIVAVLLAALAVLWFGLPPQVLREHIGLVRGPDAKFVPEVAPPQRRGVSLEIYAGKVAANDAIISSCTTMSGDRARHACRTLAVFNRSGHLFMLRMGEQLVERLKELPYVDRIDYYPPGFGPQEGQLAPDVAITLDLNQWRESGLLWSREVEASVDVTAGTHLAASNSRYQDSSTPPVLDFSWQGRLQHHSTTKGVASSAARYKQVAEHCAKQIAEALRKQFAADREKFGPLPKLPGAFYPPYRGPRAMPLGETDRLEPLSTWHGLMNRCEATWRLATDRDPAEVIDEMRQRLNAAGWKTGDWTRQPNFAHLRMTRDSVVLEIFPERQDGTSALPPTEEGPAASRPRERIVHIHYVDRMTEKELAAAVEQALAENSSIELLALFESAWTEAQCRQILGRLEGTRPKDPDGWLTVARLYQRLQQMPKARDAVLKAHALERTVPDASGLSGRVEAAAKGLGDESLAKRPVDAGLLKDLGFVELKPGAAIPDREIALDEPACFLAAGRDGKLRTIAVRVKVPSPSGGAAPQLSFVDWSEGSKSWGTGGTQHSWQIDGVGTVQVSATPLSDGQRFRLSVHITPRL
jgi:hypothetical protein